VKPAMRAAVTGVVLLVAGAVIITVSLYLSSQERAHDDQRWCDTLDLLTSQTVAAPADPAKNPSREGQYKFYLDLVHLAREYGCTVTNAPPGG
jgi:hypothetical protein